MINELVRLPDEADWYCMASDCPEQFTRLLEHLAPRNAMDIEGLGEEFSKQLVAEGLVRRLFGLYGPAKEDPLALKGFGDKKADNLVRAIAAGKDRWLSRLLFALGIRHVGRAVAEAPVQQRAPLEALAEAQAEDLKDIEGIGPVIAASIADWFSLEDNRELVEVLAEASINTERAPPGAPADDESLPASGLTFVLTGGQEHFTSLARRLPSASKPPAAASPAV